MSTPSVALTKRKSDNALMPPPPRVKRIKRPVRVLDEDTYSEALSHIIARDFFPGLLELESQEEYLDALNSKDDGWIESAGRKLAAAMTPQHGRQRRAGITPSATRLRPEIDQSSNLISPLDDKPSAESKVDLNLSLNDFLSKYTSEDAESFYKVLDKQNQKRAEKQEWLWNGNKLLAPAQIAYRKQQQKLLDSAATTKALNGSTPTSITEPDDRPAGPESWKHVGKNSLMFLPEDSDSMQTAQQKSEEISRAAPKRVIHGNTRLASQIFGAPIEKSVPPSPTLSAVKDAIAGRPRIPASEVSYDGSETPRVNGYAFVDSEEPEPEPQPKHPSDWSRLSFGDVDAEQNPFSMQESSSREKLHHRLVDKVTRKKQEQRKDGQFKTPVMSKLHGSFANANTNSATAPSLTPAGHRLLGRLGGATPLRNTTKVDIWNDGNGKTPRGPLLKGLVTPRQ